MAELKSFDILNDRMNICKNCIKKDCRKGMLGSPPPHDCPYMLEKVIFEQSELINKDRNSCE